MDSSLAFVFPGQGSQQPGMGKELCDNFKVAALVFEEASESLKLDLKKLCFEGPAETLQLTENTQPAIVVTSVAAGRVLEAELGLKPDFVAGHSVGEYAALVQAGVIDLPNAIQAVRLRGQAMQEAVPMGQGGMAAVMGVTDQQAQELCKFVVSTSGQGPLSPANYNCPGQIVVSGSKKAIDFLTTVKPDQVWSDQTPRLKVIPLNVSAPFHCDMMLPAQKTMELVLSQISFSPAKMPIIQNVHAQAETEPEIMKTHLVHQISAPVLWSQTMKALSGKGVTRSIEVGHGRVLQGLFKKSETGIEVLPAGLLADIRFIEDKLKS